VGVRAGFFGAARRLRAGARLEEAARFEDATRFEEVRERRDDERRDGEVFVAIGS
jgi:hypothetical protein